MIEQVNLFKCITCPDPPVAGDPTAEDTHPLLRHVRLGTPVGRSTPSPPQTALDDRLGPPTVALALHFKPQGQQPQGRRTTQQDARRSRRPRGPSTTRSLEVTRQGPGRRSFGSGRAKGAGEGQESVERSSTGQVAFQRQGQQERQGRRQVVKVAQVEQEEVSFSIPLRVSRLHHHACEVPRLPVAVVACLVALPLVAAALII